MKNRSGVKGGDDLGEVDGGADAGRGGADVGDGVDRAVGGVAGGGGGHLVQRDREAEVDVERGVALDRDVPAGGADVPGGGQVGGAVPGGAEAEQRAAVADAGHRHPLGGHGAGGQAASGDLDRP